jgi:AcrR family transcriptional regulator
MISHKPSQTTREQIIAVAADLFSARGFANVSIRDVCNAAGITAPTIYHYFGNKDRLFQEVIRKTLSLSFFRQVLIETVDCQPGSEKQLAAFIRIYLTDFPRNFFNPGMFLQDSTHLADSSTTQVMGEFEPLNAIARRIIQTGIQDGVFREQDVDQVVVFLMNMLMAYVLGEVHYQQVHPPKPTAEFLFKMLMIGIVQQ